MLVPVLTGGFSNRFIPRLVGAQDMAFPRLNNLSFWLLPPSLILLLMSSFFEVGATGCIVYIPLSSIDAKSRLILILLFLNLLLEGVSTILCIINLLATIRNSKKMQELAKVPLACWILIFCAFALTIIFAIVGGFFFSN